jgi:hypothetical protein
MSKSIYFLLISICLGWSKTPPEATFVSSYQKKIGHILTIHEGLVISQYSDKEIWNKLGNDTYRFSSLDRGTISEVDQFTGLLTAVLFKGFNLLIVLDDRLTELVEINFNTLTPLKDIQHIAMAGANQIWLYDKVSNKLQKFDYLRKLKLISTINVIGEVIAVKSNTEFCWVMTRNELLKFNHQGGLVNKLSLDNFTDFTIGDNYLILSDEKSHFILTNQSKKPEKIFFDKMFAGSFFLQGQTLYIYDEKTIHEFQLKF